MTAVRRFLTLLAATTVLAAGLGTGTAAAAPTTDELGPDAHPGPLHYVALGDSFSSGEGAPVDVGPLGDRWWKLATVPSANGWLGDTDGNGCHRSREAYPPRVWADLDTRDPNWGVSFRACSGAKSSAWSRSFKGEDPQSWAFDDFRRLGRADLVTIGFGGNDLGFADIVRDCVGEGFVEERIGGNPAGRLVAKYDFCRNKWTPIVEERLTAVSLRISDLIDQVRPNLKPGGKIMIVGYPRPFRDDPPAQCRSGAGIEGGIDRPTMNWLNRSVADPLNETLEREAGYAGVAFIDTGDFLTAFGEHDLCAQDRWMNRLIGSDVQQSFHPKAQYHEKVAEEILRCWDECPPMGPRIVEHA